MSPGTERRWRVTSLQTEGWREGSSSGEEVDLGSGDEVEEYTVLVAGLCCGGVGERGKATGGIILAASVAIQSVD